jgi:HEPN domain-containing protein
MRREVARFFRAGVQRLEAAKILLAGRMFRDAAYLAGYSVECMLKSLILARVPEHRHREYVVQEFAGRRAHEFVLLIELLRGTGGRLPNDLRQLVLESRRRWSVDLRYSSGRFSVEDAEFLVNAGEESLAWVKDQLT